MGLARSKVRRRFLALAIPGLAVALAVTGISYLASSGAVTTTIKASSTKFLFPVQSTKPIPSVLTTLEYTLSADITTSTTGTKTITTAVNPTWSPATNTAGSVTTPGDLAVVDASIAKTGVIVSMYITNLVTLQAHYSSFALPVQIYKVKCGTMASTGLKCTALTGTWTALSSTVTYITSTTGFLTFNLPHGYLYDITMSTGGSYYCITAPASGAGLAPAYYFTAQPY